MEKDYNDVFELVEKAMKKTKSRSTKRLIATCLVLSKLQQENLKSFSLSWESIKLNEMSVICPNIKVEYK